jgi:hypothetical protein
VRDGLGNTLWGGEMRTHAVVLATQAQQAQQRETASGSAKDLLAARNAQGAAQDAAAQAQAACVARRR